MMLFGLLVDAVPAGSPGIGAGAAPQAELPPAAPIFDSLAYVARVRVQSLALGLMSAFLYAPEGGSDA